MRRMLTCQFCTANIGSPEKEIPDHNVPRTSRECSASGLPITNMTVFRGLVN